MKLTSIETISYTISLYEKLKQGELWIIYLLLEMDLI